MSNWIGVAVSVTCGSPLGCYQGTILEADGATITLTKAFRNGFPYPKSQVTLNASDIRELSIISARAGPPTASTVALPRAAPRQGRARTKVAETLQPTAAAAPAAPARSNPIDIQGGSNRSNRNNNNAGSSGQGGSGGASSTPRSRGGPGAAAGGGGGGGGGGGHTERARRRNEACFGSAADAEIEGEFDFEKNLALFDKHKLWEEMGGSKPDLVRQTEGACGKFRHDENVVGGSGAARQARAARRPVRVPAPARGHLLYATDEGVIVPSVAGWVRRALWAALRASGPAGAALLDDASLLLARAATDVALRLVGGGRRLDACNAHQPPAVALLYAPHRIGACGLTMARLLCSHGARVTALCTGAGAARAGAAGAGAASDGAALARAHAAALQCGVKDAASAADLPAADLVILATHDPFDGPDDDGETGGPGLAAALTWARSARGALLGLEPPPAGWTGIELRASVAALLPAAGSTSLGRLHLADVAPPPRIFSALGLRYRPPFGAWSALPLHPADDQTEPDTGDPGSD